MKLTRILSCLLMAGIVWATATARAASAPTEISILTIAPGGIIYELEGHAALRIQSPETGDICVDWGLFDFDSPNFVYRFTAGETDYSTGIRPTELLLWNANRQGRGVTEHRLNLDSAQTVALINSIENALLPANRVYRYNYVKDNCSTRTFTIVEKATGDSVIFKEIPAPIADGATFRSLMAHYHANYPWYQFGIDLALGSGIDRPVNARQAAFAPVILEMMLPEATLGNQQFVSFSRPLVAIPTGAAVASPTPFIMTPMAVALLILAAAAALTFYDIRCHKRSRWFDTLVFSIFGVAGLVLTFLIFISVHEATSPNWNYLWLNPLCFVTAIGIWIKRGRRIVFLWQIVNFVLILLLFIIAATGIQTLNEAFYPLIAADLIRTIFALYTCHHDKNLKIQH